MGEEIKDLIDVLDLEGKVSAVTLSDPIPLHVLDLFGPLIEFFEVVEKILLTLHQGSKVSE